MPTVAIRSTELVELDRRAQHLRALTLGNAKRTRLAELKRDLRNGTTAIAALLEDPPAELAGYPLVDVLRWWRPTRDSTVWLQRIGLLAMRDGVNLMMPVERCGPYTRAWAAATALELAGARLGGRRAR